jgi:NADPH-dependent ferric siderophore reductase
MFGTDFYEARVIEIGNITPSMRRIVLGGGDLIRFQSKNFPDEFVRLLFVEPGSKSPVLPVRDQANQDKWVYPNEVCEPPGRYYTVRKWDAAKGEMTVDFVVHEGGVAATWASSSTVGDPVGVTTSNGRYRLPDNSSWLLIVSDITGLPAVGRILEEKPNGLSVVAHIEIPTMEDVQPLERHRAKIHWHTSFGGTKCLSCLSVIARDVRPPSGPGYIWIAGEAKEVAEARKHFRDHLGFDKNRIDAVGYWIEGHERS